MAQELNLDELACVMKDQQSGHSSGRQVVWDKNTMTFKTLGTNEQPTESQSPMNDVSKVPFYTI
jgi:hypothetical protein